MNLRTQRAPSCPSDLVLDRLHGDELDQALGQQCRLHIHGCPACQARMEQRELGFQAFGGSEQAYLARFRNRIDEEERASCETSKGERRGASWWSPQWLGAAAVMAGLCLWFSLAPQHDQNPGEDIEKEPSIRAKGGGGLTVFVSREGAVTRMVDNQELREGDRLRFALTLSEDQEVMIVGQEGNGNLYELAYAEHGGSLSVSAGSEQALPHSVELDDSTGKEAIHLVRCPFTFTMSDLKVNSKGIIEVPSECGTSTLNMIKSRSTPE